MNITELRSALRERAEDVDTHDTAERVAQVHARVRRTRRRRIAGVGALTVGALVLVGAVTNLPHRSAEPAAVHHKNFVAHSGEYDLLAATVGKPGQRTLTLDVPAHHGELFVTTVCHGAGLWTSAYAGDTRPDLPRYRKCGDDPSTPPVVPGVLGDAPGPWQYDTGLPLQPSGDQVTVHTELMREVDADGVLADNPVETGDLVPASDPGAWLGIAVYTVADPVAEVAGTKIRPRVGVNGRDYTYVTARQSKPGERQLTWTLEPSTVERYYDVVGANTMDPNTTESEIGVDMVLDGDSCRMGFVSPQFRTGGCLLSPGKPHTITATIAGTMPEQAVLGIVLYSAS
jgi:hypothetical protein